MLKPHCLSCHCGDIRIEVDAELASVQECNCSTCGRTGFLHWKVAVASVRLLTEKRRLSTYLWREITSGHHFCPTCGTAMMRTGYPDDKVSLNARCLEGVDVFELSVTRYDGRNLMHPGPEAAPPAGRLSSGPR